MKQWRWVVFLANQVSVVLAMRVAVPLVLGWSLFSIRHLGVCGVLWVGTMLLGHGMEHFHFFEQKETQA